MFIGGIRTRHDGLAFGTLAKPDCGRGVFRNIPFSQLSSFEWLGSMNPMKWRWLTTNKTRGCGRTLWLNDLA